MNFSAIELVDLIEPSEILVDPVEPMELCPVELPKVDLNDSTPLDMSWPNPLGKSHITIPFVDKRLVWSRQGPKT